MPHPISASDAGRPAVTGKVPDDLLRVSDLDPETLAELLDLAAAMKQEPLGWERDLRGGAIGCLFEKPSTRTRVSLATAAHRLGMTAIVLNRDEMQLGHGETVADTARVLSSYLDAVTVRTYDHATVEQMAEAAAIPVVNALSDTHHPCQSLADLLALREHFGSLAGLTAAFLGDGASNTCNSFLAACAAAGMHLTIASPQGYPTDPDILGEAREVMAQTGGSVALTTEPVDAVRTAQAVYAEVWVPMDKPLERDERAVRLAPYRVDDALLAHAPREAVALHCLPAVRGEEITSEVLDGPRSLVWNQAANRLPTAQAVLHTLVTTNRRRIA
ncbi:ornithine carbamoyltransferase [Streptomyces sp. NPDC059101]|uniref:ornithine carbamoyltransferase n=1 Tax=unclassified Streptomyces TaxID=2593676 RepID=UPI000C27AABF|nr:ornithine carbamoyltransferase [Streptomyces sp. CB02959]PJN38441.1 ornithine carbamoyltransferase [Streptomyces sp. CB02959]